MKLSKTTISYANKRGLDVYIDEGTRLLWIASSNEDIGEDICCYTVNENGTFSYHGNVWLPQATKEELPATIWNERKLREVIDFISKDEDVKRQSGL